MPVDVGEIGCDMLSATGRKYLRGPRGTGFLYVRRELCQQLEPPFLDLHAATVGRARPLRDSRRTPGASRTGNATIAGKVGLGVAIDYALELGHDGHLAIACGRWLPICASGLRAIPGVTVQDIGAERCGIVTFTVDGMRSAADASRRWPSRRST